ncbi:metallophosphoesterase [Thalassolituus marinus]|uniref:Metallophosphoesterase n=1 Tax=Thalassolituus marinus TaxID=671053 RepID=A0ABS7ZSB1_9GAMM|nr:metallophosphoesterase [Thalassolituus marinus]MCA6064661.1 metallophosphoesterase [Thalassolituus marinus]
MKLNTMMTAMLLLPAAGAMAMSGTPDALPDQGTVNKTVRFIAVGDTGTGEDGQYKVAAAMQALCEQKGCDFALGLGDNVYESGVDDVDDLQFVTKFEQPYAALNMPFYMTLGNHDNSWLFGGDGLDNDRGDIQVDYHYHENRQSDKWNMPARYYTFNAPLAEETPLITFISMDSNPLAAVGDADAEYWQLPYKKKEAEWLDNVMETSVAPWKIAFAHHPFLSNGNHGNAGMYDGVPGAGVIYYDMLRKHVCDRADLIIAGHDHDMQLLQADDSCGKTLHIVSGAGAKSRSLKDTERNDAYWQQGDTLGFFYLVVEGDQLTATAVTVDKVSGEYQESFSKSFTRQ